MTRKRSLKKFLWLLLVLLLCVNAVAFFHAYKFTHFDASATGRITSASGLSLGQKLSMLFTGAPMPRPVNKAKPSGRYETIRLHSNKTIECWFVPTDSARGTVALFHGYGGEKSGMLDKAEVFRGLGYNTLLVDFMGAGGSEGVQTTIGYKEAQEVKTCVDYLKGRGEHNIILFGTSMGAAAIMKTMNDNVLPVRAVVLECPFSTMQQTVENRFAMVGVPSFPLAYLLMFWGGVQNGFNAFDHNPEAYARRIHCPTLLMWGEKDDRVKRFETTEIFDHLAGPKKLVTYPLAGHENYLVKYREQWSGDVAQFLKGIKQ